MATTETTSTIKKFDVFLSGVSSEFEFVRQEVATDLRARGLNVKEQREFRQESDAATTLDLLHKYIQQCSAVICLAGQRSGSKPPIHVAEQYQHMLPDGWTEASYTQWEFFFAVHYKRRISFHVAGSKFKPDQPEPTGDDFPELQKQFLEHVKRELSRNRTYFASGYLLRIAILKEDWPNFAIKKPVALPYQSLGTLFKGREPFMQQLKESLSRAVSGSESATGATAITGHTIHGLGGVGKTRLAVEYAWRQVDDPNVSAVLFVSGEKPEELLSNIAELTGPLVLNLPEHEVPDQNVRVAAAIRWLAGNPGWFLIIDNLDNRESVIAAEQLLTQLAGGHVVMTSRLSDFSGEIQSLALDVLSEQDAIELLLEKTRGRRRAVDSDADDVAELANELGGLALALEQAGAYIRSRRSSFSDYLTAWKNHDEKVQQWHKPEVMHYPRSVATTWQTTFEELGSGEIALLQMFSFFAPEPIPQFVVESDEAESLWHAAAQLLNEKHAGDLLESVSKLAEFSMLTWDASEQAITVHRVVQEIVRSQIETGVLEDWLKSALSLLNAATPTNCYDVKTWPVLTLLVEHLETLLARVEPTGIHDPASRLCSILGGLYEGQALFARAEPLMRRALEIDEASFGEKHPEVAIGLNNLAQLLQATNRLSEAEPLMRRALEIDEASFGEKHPDVAIDLNNLAQLLQDTNRLSEAEPLMRRALEIDEASFGEEHPNVARNLNNLALLLKATNRLSEAEPLMRRALEIDEAFFGDKHPNVAIDLNNLAALFQATNRLSEAEPLMRKALEIDEASLGEKHPKVAIRLNNLAQLLQSANRLSEAEPMMRRALEIDEASFGEEHPNVAIRLNNLAQLLQATNRLGEAEPLMRRALEIDEASYGEEHPNVAIRLNNLAQLLKATNRLSEAEPMMRRALEIDVASFGEEHPKVAIRLNNLAQLLKATNRLSEAEPMMRRVLEIDEASFGEKHPELAIDLNNLASLLQATNRLSEAEPMMRRALEIFFESLG